MKKQYVLVNGRIMSIKDGLNVEDAIAALVARGRTVEKCKKPPTLKTLTKWSMDGVAKATDGCKVEPDGTCPHGKKSWLLVMGVI
jgi:hypothetical protein